MLRYKPITCFIEEHPLPDDFDLDKDIAIALVKGPFTFEPIIQGLGFQYRRPRITQKREWEGLLRIDAKTFCKISSPPLPLSPIESRIRWIYSWPLEIAQRILHNQPLTSWTLLWLPTPSGSINLMAYNQKIPVLCRFLPKLSDLAFEIAQTLAYLKRFEYKQTDTVTIFIPSSVTNELAGITFRSYELPHLTKPTTPLALPKSFKKARFRKNFPVYVTRGQVGLFILGICGTLNTAWQIKKLSHQYFTLQRVSLPPFSDREQALLKTASSYEVIQVSRQPHFEALRKILSPILEQGPRPSVLYWIHASPSSSLTLEFEIPPAKTVKNTLSKLMKFLSPQWENNKLRLKIKDENLS